MALGRNAVVLLAVGIAVGGAGFGLGAFLASERIGWTTSLWCSIPGIAGAPMAALSWTSRRSARGQVIASIAFLLGVVTSMVLVVEMTRDFSTIAHAWSAAPLAVVFWTVLLVSWGTGALARLLWFQPPRTQARLSSRRGDAGL